MLRITELSRQTGASPDEIRYLEKKGFIESKRGLVKTREVRHYAPEVVRAVELIIKYRRLGFTWNVAFQKAREENHKPALF